MHKYKLIIALSSVVIALSIGAIILMDHLIINHAHIMADREVLAESFADLENVSDLVVLATVLPDKKNCLITESDGTVTFGYTLTQLNILKIIRGKADHEVITITEEYFITDDLIGKTIWTQDEYQPAHVGSKYVFFLEKYNDASKYKGLYFPVDLKYGKYLMNQLTSEGIDQLTNQQIEIGNHPDEKYREWMKTILRQYDFEP